jgi:dipeptidyl aminopeptidase/acylaminoacyl peptidase
MFKKTLISALLALAALAAPTAALAAPSTGAVVFSKATTVEGAAKDAEGADKGIEKTVKGGLFAVREGRLNQLTEDPSDSEPSFSPDGRTIAFARGGDIFSVRPDGSGQRQLTSGPAIDSLPKIAPDGRSVVFERRAEAKGASSLYAVRAMGGGVRALTKGGNDREATFSPDGQAIAFVRSSGKAKGGNDDLYSVRPNGGGLARLINTGGVDEFAPRYFAAGIVFSRGESSEGPAAYADIYTMRRNGTRVRPQVKGVGSAYVEDVTPDGHLLLFRRDQGLWAKRIGNARAHKLSELPDNSETTSVFSSDGRRVAAFVADEDRQSLVSIDVASGRRSELAEGFEVSEGDGTVLGPVIDWQPVPQRGR